MRKLELPTARRVNIHTTHGYSSEVNPPLDPEWDDATKLAWHAAVVAYDTGLTIRVAATGFGTYCVNVGRTSSSDKPFTDAWLHLSGVELGAQAMAELISGTGWLDPNLADPRDPLPCGCDQHGPHPMCPLHSTTPPRTTGYAAAPAHD